MSRRLPPTEKEFVARLRRGEVAFPPLDVACEDAGIKDVDAVVRLAWRGKAFRFAAEYKRLSNPKAIAAAAEQARNQARSARLLPLVVASYLDDQALDALEAQEVSGIDLCGNGVIATPGAWYVRRTGHPNLFRAEGAIKNVYRKGSSVVARLFLTRPEFDSVQGALDELVRRGGRVALSTVSKVCKRLEEDLIIERKRDGATRLRLIQPEKLLDRLAANYAPPRVSKRLAGKLRGIEPAEFRRLLRAWSLETGERIARTGASSVGAYAVMARDDAEAYYCTDAAEAVRFLGERFQPADRFATITLLETRDDEVYFDGREDLAASPVETFLELSSGDKRDQETASQVRGVVLGGASPAAAE